MNTAVHFSSESGTWSTPRPFFAQLDREFHFTLDVCAMPETALCPHYYTPPLGMDYECLWPGRAECDAFAHEWRGLCWMNPPYGREIGVWVAQAFHAAQAGHATVVCLLPSRTDTAWWHDFVMRASEVRLVRGRLKFGGATSGAPFPSAVVVFRPDRSTSGLFKSYDLKGDKPLP